VINLKKTIEWIKELLGFEKPRGTGISIIIPFRAPKTDYRRRLNLDWLLRYWTVQLPGAEVIVSDDPHVNGAFSKSAAVNAGVYRSTGDILVIVDADGYIDADAVVHCADEIRKEAARGRRLWFVPYRKFYRLNEAASDLLLSSDPADPCMFSNPPDPERIQGDADPNVGHWYGAMAQILSRTAYNIVGGWDERFRGWGGEDHAAMRATDTLYWHHKSLPDQVLHLWHPQIGPQGTASWIHWKERMWEGQSTAAVNDKLSWRYYHAMGNKKRMRKLVDESLEVSYRLTWSSDECNNAVENPVRAWSA
jgi:glycosyltransferase involved in cell wall biosynthesis